MKKVTILFSLSLLTLFSTACSQNQNNVQVSTSTQESYEANKIIHLPCVPTEIEYNGITYKVQTTEPKVETIDTEIGIVKARNFKVFSLKNTDEKKAIAILVRENPKVYFNAVKK